MERARPQYACKQFLTASQAFNISMLSYQSFSVLFTLLSNTCLKQSFILYLNLIPVVLNNLSFLP